MMESVTEHITLHLSRYSSKVGLLEYFDVYSSQHVLYSAVFSIINIANHKKMPSFIPAIGLNLIKTDITS